MVIWHWWRSFREEGITCTRTSPALFTELREKACGTVRVNRGGVPPELKNNLAKGDVCSVAIDESMVALKWADKRQVSMLATVHDDSMMIKTRRRRHVQGGREEVRKPVMIKEYNKHMGGVDKSDQLLSYYGFTHRTVKWWRRRVFSPPGPGDCEYVHHVHRGTTNRSSVDSRAVSY